MADAVDRGITVSEIAPMGQAIDTGPETTAAFIGRTLRGPLHTPVLIGNVAGFRRCFGGTWPHSSLGPAVEQFFEHGGRRLYVVRVANGARGAMICLPAPHGVLVLRALEPGSTERIRAAVDYDRIPDDDREHFNLTLQRLAPETGLVIDQEIHPRLSCREGDRHFIGNALASSTLARPQLPLPAERPMATAGTRGALDPGYVNPVQPGSDGGDLTDYDLVGSAVQGTGLFALGQIEQFDLLYMPPPGRQTDIGPAAVLAAELYCRRRGAMLVMDPPRAWSGAGDAIRGIRHAGLASPNVLTYFPRLCEQGDDSPRAVGGAVAGLLCRHDRQLGPWEPIDGSGLTFSRRYTPAVVFGSDDRRRLVKQGFNVVAGANGRAALEGSVTLARNSQLHAEFTNLHVQRLCLAMTGAIERATRWAVFEPDPARLAERIEAQVHAYMSWLAETGAFADARFAVQCDAGLHAGPRDPRRGITILLSFQPAGAAEPLSLTLHQTASGCRVATSAFPPSVARCA